MSLSISSVRSFPSYFGSMGLAGKTATAIVGFVVGLGVNCYVRLTLAKRTIRKMAGESVDDIERRAFEAALEALKGIKIYSLKFWGYYILRLIGFIGHSEYNNSKDSYCFLKRDSSIKVEIGLPSQPTNPAIQFLWPQYKDGKRFFRFVQSDLPFEKVLENIKSPQASANMLKIAQIAYVLVRLTLREMPALLENEIRRFGLPKETSIGSVLNSGTTYASHVVGSVFDFVSVLVTEDHPDTDYQLTPIKIAKDVKREIHILHNQALEKEQAMLKEGTNHRPYVNLAHVKRAMRRPFDLYLANHVLNRKPLEV